VDQNFPLLSKSADRHLLARRTGGGVEFDRAPAWLRHGLGKSGLAPLESLAADLIRDQLGVRDYVIELEGPGGDPVALLVQGQATGPDAARLEVADVTDTVRERRRAAAVGAYHGLVGSSLPMLDVFQQIALYGPTDAPVIVTGETGTGKELVARALHDRSPRAEGPLVSVNCSAMTPELFESELFGHEKGSFTGAVRQHKGRFERADGGTLFLDEIGDMPAMTQSKLLRALEEGTIERVGSEEEKKVDVRVIAATNVALEFAVTSGRFRADLYHRLCVLRIHVPPLRERLGDLPALVDSFLESFNGRYKKSIRRLTPEAIRLLQDYSWPGNVRELRNVLERLVVETHGEAIGANALARWVREREYLLPGAWNMDAAFVGRQPIPTPAAAPYQPPLPRFGGSAWGSPAAPAWPPAAPPHRALEHVIEATPLADEPPAPTVEFTEETIREAFRATGGNATRAAERLGVHKATLYRHMKRLGLGREDLETEAAP
jgi:DNA-binding NtrC family response regulator